MGQSQGHMGFEIAIYTVLGDHDANDGPPHGCVFVMVLGYVASR